jgi:glycosyltransferase involved in cell wall biosynthesis
MNRPQPLRILHLTAASDAGGVSRYLYDLSLASQAAGHQVAIAGQRGAWHDLFQNAPFPWIEAPLAGNLLQLPKATKLLRNYLTHHPVDILHAHYRKASLVGRRLQRISPAPLLYTLHLSHIPLGGPWGWLTHFGDHIHSPSDDGRQWLIDQAKIPADRITVIPHGVDPAKFPPPDPDSRRVSRKDLGLTPDDRVALYVGRLEDPKNEAWLLDLAAISRTQIPNLRILLAGDGPNESTLRARIEREKLGDRVTLLGRRDPLPLLYHAADALLLPSAREGFSLACAEAMSAGLPVLRTATSGTHELIIENITGRSTPIDHDAFIAAALDFLANDSELHRMGHAAAVHIRANFTFARQVDQTLALYRKLIASNTTVG